MQESGKIFIEFMHESREVPVQCWCFSELQGRIAIGRSSNNDVVLSESVVSRWHAEIVRIGSGWMFEILGMNGAYIDGQRVDSFPLWDGACVQLGQTGPRLRFGGAALRSDLKIVPPLQKQRELEDEINANLDTLIESMRWPTAEPEPVPVACTTQAVIALGPSRG